MKRIPIITAAIILIVAVVGLAGQVQATAIAGATAGGLQATAAPTEAATAAVTAVIADPLGGATRFAKAVSRPL